MKKQFNSTKLKVKRDSTPRNKRFEQLCVNTQENLKKQITCELKKYGTIKDGDGWVYKEGEIPILLVAHLDTVHKEIPSTIYYYKGLCMSKQGIGGDDRCGVYMIMEILKKHNCHVLFVEDEEIGCVGSRKFTETELCKSLVGKFQYMIELDRRGKDDAVFYYGANTEFMDFVTKEYWKEKQGTYTDIVELSPALECASVNLSCGYYDEHKLSEYVDMEIMENNIQEVCKLIERTEPDTYYEHVEYDFTCYNQSYYGDFMHSGFSIGSNLSWYVEYCKERDDMESCSATIIEADSYEEAVGIFCIENPEIPYEQILGIYEYGNND